MKPILSNCGPEFAKIYFRIFPTEQMTWDYVKILNDHRTIYVRSLQELAKTNKKIQFPTFWTFKSDRVFYNESQTEIYNTTTDQIIET